jgi:hypothetical protein
MKSFFVVLLGENELLHHSIKKQQRTRGWPEYAIKASPKKIIGFLYERYLPPGIKQLKYPHFITVAADGF